MTRGGTVNKVILNGRAVYRDHVIVAMPGFYEVHEYGGSGEILFTARTVSQCIRAIDDVADEMESACAAGDQ
jgi:hypothetical protein